MRTLGDDAQTTHQAAAFPSSASAPAAVSAASAAAGRAAAEALALIEKLLQAAAAEEAPAEVAARALPQQPRLSHVLVKSTDALLVAMLSQLAADATPLSATPFAATAAAAPAAPAAAADSAACAIGLSSDAVRKAAEALAHAAGLADATAMMCDIPGRVLDLVLVLHYAHRAPARDRLHRHAAPSSMLPTIELLTAAPNGLLPPRLAPPPTVDSQKQGLFPVVAIARLLRHVTLSLLPEPSDFALPPPAQRQAALKLQRGCTVLMAVLDAIINPAGEVKSLEAEATKALRRDHCAALFHALLPLAAAAGSARAATSAGSSSAAAA